MKLSTVVIKTLLGALFAFLGYISAYRWFPQIVLFGITSLFPTLAAFALGAFSILLLPVIGFKVSEWFKKFIGSLIKESLTEFFRSLSPRAKSKVPRRFKRAKTVEQFKGGIVLDTSVIIDGRILDVARAGFLAGKLILPKFILNELHDVADSKDDLRRKRGRRGFDCLEHLKKLKKKDFVVWEGKIEGDDVDQRLISLAKGEKVSLATVDFNLNKAAKVSGVAVLNINELANALRIILIPGEMVKVKLVQKGKEEGQGVGYLEDGTMIVVEGGESEIGEELEVEVTRSLQTEAGRMIFAQLATPGNSPD